MALSTITVCDRNKIRVFNGLPDAPYPVEAVLESDTHTVKVVYDEDPQKPAHIDASVACRKCGCFPSDLIMVGWSQSLEEAYEGAPWIHDMCDSICIPHVDWENFHIVSDFVDLF